MTIRAGQRVSFPAKDDAAMPDQKKRVRPPTDGERQELEVMTGEAIGRVALRAQMVLLSARGYSAPKIAEIQEVANVTVYKWIGRFDEGGPASLYDRKREGRPPKLGKREEEEIERVLENPPTEEGDNATRWTAPRLARHLEDELGVEVHPDTVRRALQRLEYSWKRPRRVLPKDPGYEERMAEIEEALNEAGPQTTVLFEDETELKRFPPLRRAWMRVGEQRSVAVPEQNDKFALYGALDIGSGEVIAEPYPKGRSDHTKAFLRKVLGRVDGKILLVWDHATWHVSKKVGKLLSSCDRLEVLLLPKRAPEANPVEDLWRVLKNQVAANVERSLDALKEACRRFFDELTPEQALQTAGIQTD